MSERTHVGCPKTDQKTCFDDSGSIIPCSGTGQDGESNTGTAWPEPRFVEHGDTICDKLTGLMWPRHASLSQFPLTWEESAEFISDLNDDHAFGYGDWRLPDRFELFSLISHSQMNPALPEPHPFIYVFDGYYWTATPCARLPRQAWYVHLGGGRVFKGMKHGSYMVWPVRGNHRPAKSPSTRFIVEGETVYDSMTGLTWMQAADLTGEPVTWSEAFSSIRRMNLSTRFGHDDWRLPNIRELDSLVDVHRHSPAIADTEIFTNIRAYYWSSTTSVYDASYAWTVYTEDGNLGVGFKDRAEFFVWGVRGGHPA